MLELGHHSIAKQLYQWSGEVKTKALGGGTNLEVGFDSSLTRALYNLWDVSAADFCNSSKIINHFFNITGRRLCINIK
jgi:hypothetical protein